MKKKISKKETDIDRDNMEKEILIKIAKLLPQDIIINLPRKKITEIYNDLNKINLKEYLKIYNSYKIYIIYTFSIISITISITINEINESSDYIMISGIKSEEELKNKIDDIINRIKEGKKKKNSYFYILSKNIQNI